MRQRSIIASFVPRPKATALGLLVLFAAVTPMLVLERRAHNEESSALLDSSASQERLIQILRTREGRVQAAAAGLQQVLNRQEALTTEVQAKMDDIQSGLSQIEKERSVDAQLLQKYSKVYFLNENYKPVSLVSIPSELTFPQDEAHELLTPALPFLLRLLSDAKAADVDILVDSSFRSFYDQQELKSAYRVKFGSGANAFSADQGYSEHQLGTTVDFTTKKAQTLSGFQNTKAYDWLADNAYKYGFTLSYPPKNTYYVFEPWHWRFVGVALATKLHDEKKHFYDLEQREIDTYRAKMFDQ